LNLSFFFLLSFFRFFIVIGLRITNETQHKIYEDGDLQLDEHNNTKIAVPPKGYKIFLWLFQWTIGDEQKQ
jgi:hypothetical protein